MLQAENNVIKAHNFTYKICLCHYWVRTNINLRPVSNKNCFELVPAKCTDNSLSNI